VKYYHFFLSFHQPENPAARADFKKELKVYVVVLWRVWIEIKCRFLFAFAFLLLSSPPILTGVVDATDLLFIKSKVWEIVWEGSVFPPPPPPIYDPLVTFDSLRPWFSLRKLERLRIRCFILASDRPSPRKPTQYSSWSNVCLHLVNSKYNEVPPASFVSAMQERLERRLQRVV